MIVAGIALLTERRCETSVAAEGDWYLRNILREDQLLGNGLRSHGLSSARVDWARPDVDWSRFRCAVFRTTWDYFDRFDEFVAWLSELWLRNHPAAAVPLAEAIAREAGVHGH